MLSVKKKRISLSSVISALIGMACALVLAAAFYGTMAYQLADGTDRAVPQEEAAGLLALPEAQLISEHTEQQETGGQLCTVTTRVYQLSDGEQARAVSASPAAYITRLADEKWTAQPMTGFTLAGLDAVYSVRGDEGVLSARSGERIYMLHAAADEQVMYILGAGACLE